MVIYDCTLTIISMNPKHRNFQQLVYLNGFICSIWVGFCVILLKWAVVFCRAPNNPMHTVMTNIISTALLISFKNISFESAFYLLHFWGKLTSYLSLNYYCEYDRCFSNMSYWDSVVDCVLSVILYRLIKGKLVIVHCGKGLI